MNWKVPRIWEGGDVWILGGGPSVVKQFEIPEEVVQQVMKGILPPSTYSPYMKALHDKHVIGINVAYLIGNWIDMVFFGDNKFFLRNKAQLATWPGLKISCFSEMSKYEWIKYVPRDNSHKQGISPNAGAVAWNCNSGAAAISIAANAGAKRIFLLGFDMKLNGNGDQHWHKLYKTLPSSSPAPPRRNNGIRHPVGHTPFARHLKGFPSIAKDAQLRGIEIINVCPDSAITVFPRVSLKEVL
jgi:hypothetical protein